MSPPRSGPMVKDASPHGGHITEGGRNIDAAEPILPVYNGLRRFTRGAFRILENVTVEGVENLPTEGAAIVAPNHLSAFDHMVLMAVQPRMIRWIGKAEYLDNPATRFLIRTMGIIPVDRDASGSGANALDAAVRVLEGGDMFGIFPEGTRTLDGKLHKGKTGVARVAIRADVPIIPVGLIGVDQMQTAKDPLWMMRIRKEIIVRIGESIDTAPYAARPNQALAPRQLTDDVMFEISRRSGQDYVDEYMRKPDQPASSVTTQSPDLPANDARAR